jgi:hypothetical protein
MSLCSLTRFARRLSLVTLLVACGAPQAAGPQQERGRLNIAGIVSGRPFQAQAAVMTPLGRGGLVLVFEHPVECDDPRVEHPAGDRLTPGEHAVTVRFDEWPAQPESVWTREKGVDVSFIVKEPGPARHMSESTVRIVSASKEGGVIEVDARSTKAAHGIDASAAGSIPFRICR